MWSRFDFDPLAVAIMLIFWVPGWILVWASSEDIWLAIGVGMLALGSSVRKNYE